MFTITIGPTTTQVECPLVEAMADDVQTLGEGMVMIDKKLDLLLEALGIQGQPRIEFTIGPVRQKKV